MIDPLEAKKLKKELDFKLKQLQSPFFFAEFERIWGKPLNLLSIHAYIGKNNNTYVDSVRDQFLTKEDYIAKWLSGLRDEIHKIESEQRANYNGNIYQNTPTHNLLRAVQHSELQKYILLFLERNFYNKYQERIRKKPIDELISIWIGNNNLIWGILISPVFRNLQWTNDKSEMRKVKYQYWTIGHILAEGIIDPLSEIPYKFSSLDDFYIFYSSILIRLSNSDYEKKLMEMYVAYLKKSSNPNEEPLLIPELRYNKETKHIFRLDFTILNPYNMSAIGFEISPASSHNSIQKLKDKKQTQINEELKMKWQKEIDKRNQYFSKYGITVLTFADDELENLDECFSVIRKYLMQRAPTINLKDELSKIEGMDLN